jgi:hypothetical protein
MGKSIQTIIGLLAAISLVSGAQAADWEHREVITATDDKSVLLDEEENIGIVCTNTCYLFLFLSPFEVGASEPSGAVFRVDRNEPHRINVGGSGLAGLFAAARRERNSGIVQRSDLSDIVDGHYAYPFTISAEFATELLTGETLRVAVSGINFEAEAPSPELLRAFYERHQNQSEPFYAALNPQQYAAAQEAERIEREEAEAAQEAARIEREEAEAVQRQNERRDDDVSLTDWR